MLEFILFNPDNAFRYQKINVNPVFVESVQEGNSPGGLSLLAIITTASGDKHIVLDENRDVAQRIIKAQNGG